MTLSHHTPHTRQALGRVRRPALGWPSSVAVLSFAFFAFLMWSADAASVKVWDQVEVKLPARFYGNYATNEDTGRKEFIFGVSSSFVIFGWLERAPQRFNKSPRRLLVRYLKSSLRSDGYRMVAKTEKLSGGRWRADFAGRSQGASYRRQVTIVPVRHVRQAWLMLPLAYEEKYPPLKLFFPTVFGPHRLRI
jgi:hypothetical protein